MRLDYVCPDCGDEKKDCPLTRAHANAPLCYCTGVGREMEVIPPEDGMNEDLYDEQRTENG
ncbi:MAG: hypothetical protein ACTSXE_02530 [Candidatus Thorarchaeota archaeon]